MLIFKFRCNIIRLFISLILYLYLFSLVVKILFPNNINLITYLLYPILEHKVIVQNNNSTISTNSQTIE